MATGSRFNSAAPGIKTGPEGATGWSFPATLTSWTHCFSPRKRDSRVAMQPIGVELRPHANRAYLSSGHPSPCYPIILLRSSQITLIVSPRLRWYSIGTTIVAQFFFESNSVTPHELSAKFSSDTHILYRGDLFLVIRKRIATSFWSASFLSKRILFSPHFWHV